MADYRADSGIYSRTAGNQAGQYKTVQAWKTRQPAKPTAIDAKQNPSQTTAVKPVPAAQIDKTTPAQKTILTNLEKAADGKVGTFDTQLTTGMAYAQANGYIDYDLESKSEGYQFEDVVDVVNPLHHLPVVGMVYRGLSGDTIHPMSQIIGGAIYGGPVGAVTGTANAISQIQTGKDLGDHALSLVGLGSKTPSPTSFGTSLHPSMINGFSANTNGQNNPVQQLTEVVKDNTAPAESLGSAMSFVNLAEPNRIYEKIKIADGRTAGSAIVEKRMAGYRHTMNTAPLSKASKTPVSIDLQALPKREAITTVQLSAMPPKREI